MRPKIDRAEEVLKALVERYIQDGEPVGSKAIAQAMVNAASPATIRNVMAQLEQRGLIHSPHTSAGRVPTQLGYRIFVDTLLTVSSPGADNVDRVKKRLLPDKTPQELMEEASEVLSDLTSMAGIVMVPKSDRSSLRQVEFLPLEGNRVLVILVLNDREVQNRIITTSHRYSESELQQAANYLNQHFIGNALGRIRDSLLSSMRDDKVRMDSLMQTVIEVASQSFQSPNESECVVSGQSNLLGMVDLRGLIAYGICLMPSSASGICWILWIIVSKQMVYRFLSGRSRATICWMNAAWCPPPMAPRMRCWGCWR